MAERKNRTVVEMARSSLKAKGRPDYFWGEAVATAVYFVNISPIKVVWNATPLEAWNGKKPRILFVMKKQQNNLNGRMLW